MSDPSPATVPSSSRFQSLFERALTDYQRQTKNDLRTHPLAARLINCDSPDDIVSMLQGQFRGFNQHHGSNERMAQSLRSTVLVLSSISGRYMDPLPFSPVKPIYAGLGILLSAAASVNSRPDAFIEIFERLGGFFRRLESYTSIPPTPAMTDGLIKILVEVLHILGIVTRELTEAPMKRLMRNIMTDGRSRLDDAMMRLDKLTQEETLMAMAHLMTAVDRITRVTFGATPQVESDSKQKQLLQSIERWLSPPDHLESHKLACQAHYEETSAWFLQSDVFKSWKSTGSFLWVHGKPGAGKSVLCSTIIENIEVMCKTEGALMGYFYFDLRHNLKQILLNMVSSLLMQLSTRSKHCCDALARLHSAHDGGADTPRSAVLTDCLKQILSGASQTPVYLILDALDGCSNTSGMPSPREEVLRLVKELVKMRLPNLRLCVVSRLEVDIRTVLEPLTTLRVSLDDEDGHKRDIITYINFIVHSDRIIKGWGAEDKQMIIDKLSESANGMFQFISAQLDKVRTCLPQDVGRILDGFPHILDEKYEHILKGIRNSSREHAHLLLQCLAVAVKPLRIEELAEVLAVNFDDATGIPKLNIDRRPDNQEHAVLSACSSLIAVVDIDGFRVVQFTHRSIKAFLSSARLANSGGRVARYHVDLEHAHSILAQACLSVLLHLDNHIDRDSIKNFPLAEYAAKHWFDHARVENVAGHIQEGTKLLFDQERPHFANWIWIHDMDESSAPPTTHPKRPNATPLYYATLCGLHGLAERLIKTHPEDVDVRGGRYTTAIHAALYKGHLSIARLLMDHNADVNLRDDEDSTPLHIAAQNEDPELVEYLLAHGAEVDARKSGHLTPLFIASKHGNFRVVRLLIDKWADVNVQDDKRSTPLHITAGNGNFNIVCELLSCGADVDAREHHGLTPLHLASEKGKDDVVEVLIKHRADVNALDDTNSNPLHCALANENLEIVELLIQNGVDMNAPDNRKGTPLHIAAATGNFDSTDLLVKKGADVNARDNNESTPMHLASDNGSFEVVELLINHNADTNAVDNNGSSPLHLASDNNDDVDGRSAKLVELLILNGANVNAHDRNGLTPLHIASRWGSPDVVKLLLTNGGDLNARDSEGRTPLHLASKDKKMSHLLITHRADVYARDNDGAMPFERSPVAGRTTSLRPRRLAALAQRDGDGTTAEA